MNHCHISMLRSVRHPTGLKTVAKVTIVGAANYLFRRAKPVFSRGAYHAEKSQIEVTDVTTES